MLQHLKSKRRYFFPEGKRQEKPATQSLRIVLLPRKEISAGDSGALIHRFAGFKPTNTFKPWSVVQPPCTTPDTFHPPSTSLRLPSASRFLRLYCFLSVVCCFMRLPFSSPPSTNHCQLSFVVSCVLCVVCCMSLTSQRESP